jgi:hypothetical protein
MKNIIAAATIAIAASASAQELKPLDLEYKGGSQRVEVVQVEQPKLEATSSCAVNLKTDPLTYATVAALVADLGTTRNVAKDPRHYRETGPASIFIGNTPSMGEVNVYFISLIALNLATRCYAPKWASNIILSVNTVAHGSAAIGNYRVGAKISF